MQFKIILTPDRPTRGDLVLENETTISGLKFIEEVGKCLRRSIDHIARERHVTLGALSVYELTVPQQMAIDSEKFETTTTIPVIVENNLLSHYIFYGASVDNRASGRPCYPYMHSEATLVSYIDELQFLNDWAAIGYPERVAWNNGLVEAVYGSSGSSDKNKIGCDGCTCHRGDPEPHKHHHHHHECHDSILDRIPGSPDDIYYPKHHCCDDTTPHHPPHYHGPGTPEPPHYTATVKPKPFPPKQKKSFTAIM